jgi:hypothetical protein
LPVYPAPNYRWTAPGEILFRGHLRGRPQVSGAGPVETDTNDWRTALGRRVPSPPDTSRCTAIVQWDKMTRTQVCDLSR